MNFEKTMLPTLMIAIAGPSGSGKTQLAHNLIDQMRAEGLDAVSLLHEDAYYRSQSHISFEERLKTNYDHPDAFDYPLLIEHLTELSDGKSISCPVYNYEQHTRSSETIEVSANPIVILEGILVLANPQLRNLFDMKFFVDTPLDICLSRRIRRDVAERGRSIDSVVEQYLQTVRPMYYQYVEPSKQFADILVPHGGYNWRAIELIKSQLLQKLR
ncbi:MAG: uridine kinase [Pseudomonadota bacterium]